MFYFNNFKILLNYVVRWQSRSFLTGLLQYLAKNMALLVSRGGGWGKALLAGSLKKYILLRLPLCGR